MTHIEDTERKDHIELICGEYHATDNICRFKGYVKLSLDYPREDDSRMETLAKINLKQILMRDHKLGKHDEYLLNKEQ